jgi:hypothetical protein
MKTYYPGTDDDQPPAKPRLAELEAIIERGMRTFIEVGNALLEIRNRRLYREQGFKTFEDYCRERWNMSRTYAYRQIDAAKVVQNLSPIGDIPLTEAQARELARVSPERQREIAATIDFSNTTAAEIRALVRSTGPEAVVYFEITIDQRDSVAFHPAYAYRDAVDFDFVEKLAGSIDAHGQFHPVLVMPDRRTIIDGRYRFLACGVAGVPTWCEVWDGGTSAEEILEVIQILHETFKPLAKQERTRQFRDLEGELQ